MDATCSQAVVIDPEVIGFDGEVLGILFDDRPCDPVAILEHHLVGNGRAQRKTSNCCDQAQLPAISDVASFVSLRLTVQASCEVQCGQRFAGIGIAVAQ